MRENSSRNQDGLKYQKLYNWGRTLIMSGVLRNMDKFPSEHMLQNKFGYSRQTVRNALDRLEQDGLIARVKGSGTYVSYAPEKDKEERPRIGLILSYFSDYLFPQVYEGIESVLREEGYEISVSVTRNRGFIECLSDFGIDFQEDWTAMILYNDEVAGSYMDFLKDRGLRVPDDRGSGLAGKEVFVPVSGNV